MLSQCKQISRGEFAQLGQIFYSQGVFIGTDLHWDGFFNWRAITMSLIFINTCLYMFFFIHFPCKHCCQNL